jgi:nucleotide-binding universal stress UspA family protein
MLDEKATILVAVELPKPEPLAPELVRLISSLQVILIGWYAVPEQTNPEQARDQFEEEAREALDELAGAFRAEGSEIRTHLVFTGDRFDTIERISAEEQNDAVLIARPVDRIERILVPLRDLPNAERIAHFVADLVQDGTTDVTLLHILKEGEQKKFEKQDMLGEMAGMMVSEGIDGGLIRLNLQFADNPGDAIIEEARAYDVVVLGETEPSVREVIFGSVSEKIAEKANIPVVIVRSDNV